MAVGRRLGLLLPFLCASINSAAAQEADLPEPNPGRPTVSTPATLTPTGYLQFETGLLFARQSPEVATRLGLNSVIKLTVSQRLELLLQGEPVVAGPIDRVKAGGLSAGAQFVALRSQGDGPTVSVGYFRTLFEGDTPDVDIGSARQSGLLLVSFDAGKLHIDANASASEQVQDARARVQTGETLSLSHPVGRFTVSMELWRFTQPFLHGRAAGNLWALSYPARRNLIVDAGFQLGLTETSTRWETFAGFTYLLPARLW